jgi:hypothetical protein
MSEVRRSPPSPVLKRVSFGTIRRPAASRKPGRVALRKPGTQNRDLGHRHLDYSDLRPWVPSSAEGRFGIDNPSLAHCLIDRSAFDSSVRTQPNFVTGIKACQLEVSKRISD